MRGFVYNTLSAGRTGFALVEMIITVIIISTISSYAFSHSSGMAEKARYARAMEDVMALTSAVSLAYGDNNGNWEPQDATGETGSENGLDPIFGGSPGATAEIGKRLTKKPADLTDPWGEPYRVKVETDGVTAKATVYCVSAEEISSGGSEEGSQTGGNSGNGNGQGNGGVGNGNGQGAENGNGHNKDKDKNKTNNGNGNNSSEDEESGSEESGGWYDSESPAGENGIRPNRLAGNAPMSAALVLR